MIDYQVEARRNDVHMIRLHGNAVRDLHDRHGGDPRQDLGKRALAVWIEVRDDDVRHT